MEEKTKKPRTLKIIVGVIGLIIFLSYLGDIEESLSRRDKIGIVEIEGVIVESAPIIEELLSFKKDAKVKAVVIRIDSPGGGVGPSQEISNEIIKLASQKKVIASIGSLGASGGYYIACSAHKIVANPGSVVGSIGAIMEFINVEDLMSKIGVKGVVIKSGKYKDIASPIRPMSQEEKKIIQEMIDSVVDDFVTVIAKGRNLPTKMVKEIADGRIFSGSKAKALGLIDRLGNFQDAIELAKQEAKIKGEAKIVYSSKKKGFLKDLLLGKFPGLSLILESKKFRPYQFSFDFLYMP